MALTELISDGVSESRDKPAVSCLMVTLPIADRLPHFTRSVAAYCAQTLGNTELVILANDGTESGRAAIIDHVRSLKRRDIRIITPPGLLTLGELRNISVECAAGEVFCQWDDDDLCHPQRLERQLAALIEGDHEAVFLQEVVQYFPHSRTLYCANWRATEAAGHPGTLMIRKSVPIHYPMTGAVARLGEDTEVALSLRRRGRVGYLTGAPHLFVYVSHGKNSWDEGHHRMLASKLSISQGLLRRREVEIRQGLKFIDFGSGALEVHGSNGLAFTICPDGEG